MFRRIINLALSLVLLTGVVALSCLSQAQAQTPAPTPIPAPTPEKPEKQSKQQQPTAEAVAETVIYVNGTREGMAQVRRTGNERGRITRINVEGNPEEVAYDRRFIRGENMEKDRIRLEQKMPTAEYALIFSGGQTWGIINEAIFTPRQDTAQEFLARQWHGLDALLRYKENGSTVAYIGKEKQMGVDLHVVDLTDKEKRRTRFYISAKTARVLSLEYEEASGGGGKPVKLQRKFYDYRLAQGTFVPFRTVLYRDGKQAEETRIMTITYGSKVDESLFVNPNAPATTTTTTTSAAP